MKVKICCIILMLSGIFSGVACAAELFEFKTDDRVLFIGDALVERDIAFNYLETIFTVRTHGKKVTFRNAGWSGDTVRGESRAVFGSQKEGYDALVRIVNETHPNVVFVCYGMNESFEGPAGLARFEEAYNTLLENVTKPELDKHHVEAPKGMEKDRKGKVPNQEKSVQQRPVPRLVLVTPIAFQSDEANSLAAGGKQNENLKLYAEAIKKIAAKRAVPCVDLFTIFGAGNGLQKPVRLTHNGMHLNAEGYKFFAAAVDKSLGFPAANWAFVPASQGDYEPVSLPAATPLEKLRSLIAAKNLQFFNKWRPQNDTYLFLFRKSEQGRNAKEIPEFDPFIEAKETEIFKLAAEVAKGMGL